MATKTKTTDSEKAEQILFDLVLADREPDYSELLHLTSTMGWDDKQLRRERGRIRNVVRESDIAGSASDRDAMGQEVERTAAALAENGPRLDAEIEKLAVADSDYRLVFAEDRLLAVFDADDAQSAM